MSRRWIGGHDIDLILYCKENKTKEVQDIKLGKHKTKPFKYQEEAIKYGLVHNN